MQQECHYVIDLEVPDEVILDRLLQRGRKDDNQQTIAHRLDVYRQQTAPVIDYYKKQGSLYPVPGDRDLDEVTQSLQKIIKKS
jgi:adenylate kinase